MHKYLLILFPTIAFAAPPPAGSEDHSILSPHSSWIHSLSRSGVSCCDMADGRPVEARIRDGSWEVRFRPGQLEGAPTEWTKVPPEAVLRRENPVGAPIAFFVNGRIFCFIPASTF